MPLNPLSGRRFLLVDDDESYHYTIGLRLTQKDATVTSVFSIQEAKTLLMSQPFDLILLDSYLVDGLGAELLEFMLQNKVACPVIMITGDEEQQSMQQYFLLGVSGYLLKPINVELLELVVQRCLDAHLNEQKLQQQNRELEQLLDEQQQEEELARHVYRHLSQSFSDQPDAIQSFMRSSKSFNGDFFVAEQLQNGNTLMILMDAAGHGLASAISVLPAVSTIRAMLHEGTSMQNIVHEINAKLCAEIPEDRFVAMIAIEVNYIQAAISIINAGMPEVLILNENGQVHSRIKSQSLPLGIVERNDFNPYVHTHPLHTNQHLFFYSDGLIEQRGLNGEAFGKSGLTNVIRSLNSTNALLNQVVDAFSCHSTGAQVEDDVSVCCVSLGQLHEMYQGKQASVDGLRTGHMQLVLDFAGDLLAPGNMISVLDDVLNRIKLNTLLRQKAFTVFSELINNALDHGVLRLDSSLKHDFESFGQYLEERENRLKTLEQNDRIRLTLGFEPEIGQLYFDIEDSGSGYQQVPSEQVEDEALFGRGLNLVHSLCEQIQVFAPGNRTSVLIK
ncbi:SpoIIE family protein phosphatase [Paraglaciecola chathamensis]|uniref:SpoIIE family protein phosphatase n=1 Tax=Paraglaciecola chathamensis TaxID=368405 RepID=A0ABS0WCT2_9ALTE|nr:SpoIIE family protein phosphatase [Paraglaciecola chathamensis]MBJ2136261.1 SpoIIE family protein phosphatase [Paraglaciecola chathamensis]